MLPAMQTINPKHWSEKHEGGEEVQMTLNPRFAYFWNLAEPHLVGIWLFSFDLDSLRYLILFPVQVFLLKIAASGDGLWHMQLKSDN